MSDISKARWITYFKKDKWIKPACEQKKKSLSLSQKQIYLCAYIYIYEIYSSKDRPEDVAVFWD